MRDPLRIPIILDKLELIWAQNPDWRFGQLLYNTRLNELGFYEEDDQALQILKQAEELFNA